MSGSQKSKPKSITIHDVMVETEVSVNITEEMLLESGWIPGDGGEVLTEVEKWHADFHQGPFRFCGERPCYEIGKLVTL